MLCGTPALFIRIKYSEKVDLSRIRSKGHPRYTHALEYEFPSWPFWELIFASVGRIELRSLIWNDVCGCDLKWYLRMRFEMTFEDAIWNDVWGCDLKWYLRFKCEGLFIIIILSFVLRFAVAVYTFIPWSDEEFDLRFQFEVFFEGCFASWCK